MLTDGVLYSVFYVFIMNDTARLCNTRHMLCQLRYLSKVTFLRGECHVAECGIPSADRGSLEGCAWTSAL